MVTWHGILGQDGSEELRSQKCINWARLSRAQKQGDQVDIGEVCKLLVTGVSKSHTVIAIDLENNFSNHLWYQHSCQIVAWVEFQLLVNRERTSYLCGLVPTITIMSYSELSSWHCWEMVSRWTALARSTSCLKQCQWAPQVTISEPKGKSGGKHSWNIIFFFSLLKISWVMYGTREIWETGHTLNIFLKDNLTWFNKVLANLLVGIFCVCILESYLLRWNPFSPMF